VQSWRATARRSIGHRAAHLLQQIEEFFQLVRRQRIEQHCIGTIRHVFDNLALDWPAAVNL
jgi:hypothetical protein